jgi:2-methylisocitrate lyase-like PEP mutase family enzyme
MATKSERLRAALERPELALLPGGFSPLHARMCDRLGFDAFFMSGSQVGAYIFGVPDVGLLSMRDMVDSVRRLAAGSEIPIFADADTGYGNAINVRHTVREYVRAGAAGLHIEDQEFPKRSGTAAGRRCISLEEAIGKYRAAVDAARELDEDFVICARCDLIGAEDGSFEAAVERCIAYKAEADVDLIWLNTVPSKDEVREALHAIPGPVMITYGGPAPAVTLDEWQEWGAAAAIFPGMTTGVGLNAVWDSLNDFKLRGMAANGPEGARTRNKTWGNISFQELVDDAAIKDLEARYLTTDQQRDYDHTFGHVTRP